METENTNFQPEQAVPKKKMKRGLIIGIVAAVVVVAVVAGILIANVVEKNNLYKEAIEAIEDGDIDDAVDIHEELGDYKDLKDRIIEGAASEVKTLLKRGKYENAVKVLKYVRDYDDAVTGIALVVAEYTEGAMADGECSGAMELYSSLGKYETVQSAAAEQITAYTVSVLQTDIYTAQNIYNSIKHYDFDMTEIIDAFYIQALEKIASEEFDAARTLLYTIEYDKDVSAEFQQIAKAEYLAQCMANLENYLQNENWSSARYLVNNFDGDNTPLVELFLQYSKDDTILAQLQAALEAQQTVLATEGHTYMDLYNAEWEKLSEYTDLPFLDETLCDLMDDYLDHLQDQGYYANYYDNYDYYEDYQMVYYWNYREAAKYAVLEELYNDYGFASDNSQLAELFLGKSEALYAYADAYYDLGSDLNYSFHWSSSHLADNGYKCITFTNETECTFVLNVRSIGENGEILEEGTVVYGPVRPGEAVEIAVGTPGEYSWNTNWWNLEWEITEIYIEEPVTYAVTVVDTANNPVPNVEVQLWLGETYVSALSDETGVATFEVLEDTYAVCILSDAYTMESIEQRFEDGTYHMTIVAIPITVPAE